MEATYLGTGTSLALEERNLITNAGPPGVRKAYGYKYTIHTTVDN
jgi:hypothetical protein